MPDHDANLPRAELIAAYATDRAVPCLRMNFVTSADGAVTVDGYSEGLQTPPDNEVFALLRMLADAVMVGAGTLRHEGYNALKLDPARREWRVTHGLEAYP